MIGRLQGTLLEKQPPHLLVDVGGVGYEVLASMATFSYLPELHHKVTLFTHLIVREDAHQLYGFYHSQERELFRTLIKINGIGPKTALSILSSTEPDQFIRCIVDNNVTSLVRLPGIGKKTAERLVIEMRDKFAHALLSPLSKPSAEQDAINALISLGYSLQESNKMVSEVNEENILSEELIRRALKNRASQ